MTKTLQILFILILGLILTFWLGDLIWGTPVDVADKAITEGWSQDNVRYEAEKSNSRLWTLIYAIPTLILLYMTIKSIQQNNNRFFYWTFLIGLTLFQIIPTTGLLSKESQDPSFIRPILITLFIIFIGGQIFSVYRIAKIKKSEQLN